MTHVQAYTQTHTIDCNDAIQHFFACYDVKATQRGGMVYAELPGDSAVESDILLDLVAQGCKFHGRETVGFGPWAVIVWKWSK